MVPHPRRPSHHSFLQISVRDGNFDDLDGLDPTIKWEDSSSSGQADLSYGIEAAVRPTTDIASLPRSIWGKVSTDVSGWGVSARADVEGADFGSADFEVDAANSANDIAVKMVASAAGGFNVRSVEATKGLDIDGARVTVNPRFNLEDDSPDVVINYNNGASNVTLTASADAQEIEINHNMGDTDIKVVASKDAQEVEIQHSVGKTDIKLVASKDAQEVTISQQIDDNNRLSPTINNDGDRSVEWERTLGDDSSLTATLKPNESIDVEWEDGAWTANINMPLDGTSISGANVGIKRDVQF